MADANAQPEIITIFESDDLVAFTLAKALLDEAGVEYAVVESAPPSFGFSPMLHQVRRIQIPAWRKQQALELMSDLADSEIVPDDLPDDPDNGSPSQT